MALIYKNQSRQEALAKKLGLTQAAGGYRLSDLSSVLFGSRGNTFDELQYMRNKNTSAAGVDDRMSNSWVKFAKSRGVTGTDRADQAEREFYTEGSYP